MPNSSQMPSTGENGEADTSSNPADSGDIAGASIPGTSNSSQSSGNSEGSSADSNGEMANTQNGTETVGGMEGGTPDSQAGSNMPGSTASNTSGSGENGIDVSVQTGSLPGLEPFPGGLPGDNSGSLEDIVGSGADGGGTTIGNTGSPSTSGGSAAGYGTGNDPVLYDGPLGGGAGEQGDAPLGGQSGSGTIAAGGQNGNGDDPFGDLANGRNQPMTAADRQAVLDDRLEASIAVFDGMILSEREQAQGAANENAGGGGAGGGGAGGLGGANGGLSDGDGNSENPIVIASAPTSSSGNGRMPNMGRSREGDFDTSNQASFPAPADIPSGNDDDVVARQLREAAMSEPDPELRERLWNEYRTYTGLPIPEEAIADPDLID